MIRFVCPHCDKSYKADQKHAGRRIRCKACDEPFVVEPAEEEDAASFLEPDPEPRRRKRPRRPLAEVEDEDDDADDDGPPPRRGSRPAARPAKRKAGASKSKKKSAARSKAKDGDEDEMPAWQLLVWGGVLFALGIGLYVWFGQFEREGGSVRMPAILLAIYKITGKTGVMLIVSGLGLLSIAGGIRGMMSKD